MATSSPEHLPKMVIFGHIWGVFGGQESWPQNAPLFSIFWVPPSAISVALALRRGLEDISLSLCSKHIPKRRIVYCEAMEQAEEVVETPASKRPKTAEEPPPLSGLSAKQIR